MNPMLGIFLARDPWSGDMLRPGSMNGFNYTEGNPVNRIDPNGQKPIIDICDEHPEYCSPSVLITQTIHGSIFVETGYNPSAAVEYAIRYGDVGQDARRYNPDYGIMWGTDCTNFVPQILAAGGLGQRNDWYFHSQQPQGKPSAEIIWNLIGQPMGCGGGRSDCSYSWSSAPDLRNYLVKTLHFPVMILSFDETQIQRFIDIAALPKKFINGAFDQISIGDVVFYYQEGLDSANHVAFVYDFGPATQNGNPLGSMISIPNQSMPQIIDHSSTSGKPRAINDIGSASPKVEVVHIPDEILIEEYTETIQRWIRQH